MIILKLVLKDVLGTVTVYFLRHMKCKDNLNDNQKKTIKLQAAKYILIQGDLYWKNQDGILYFCLDIY